MDKILECEYCPEQAAYDPKTNWIIAAERSRDDGWLIEGSDFDDYTAICPECTVLEAR